jgi:hypothetical protein
MGYTISDKIFYLLMCTPLSDKMFYRLMLATLDTVYTLSETFLVYDKMR